VCTVTEDALAPIDGYTWGTPEFTPDSITIDTKGGTFEIVVDNSITRDRGTLKVLKTLSNPDGASVPASFTVNYDCGVDTGGSSLTGTLSVAPGSPATVSGIPTGNSCSISEVTPTDIPGYTWGTITYSPDSSVTISEKDATYELTVGNSITRDRGTLKIEKELINNEGATVQATFRIDYDCGLDTDGSSLVGFFDVAPGTPEYVYNIPTGNTCSITEVTPEPVDNFTWMPVSYDPQSVEISTKGGTFTVKAVNTILPKSHFTDTMYCPLPADGFRLIFIQDGVTSDGKLTYRLNATNPGQYYYNVFYMGEPGAYAQLDIEVPWPFITQGAVPIQVHDDVGFTTIDGQSCYVPSESLPDYTITTQDDTEMSPSGEPIITFADYDVDSVQDFGGRTIVHVEGEVPESGMLYVTIHLDYGLKKTTDWLNQNPLGTEPNSPALNDATGVEIDDPQWYEASYSGSDTGGGSSSDSDDFNSYNAFKTNPGVGGLAIEDLATEQVYTKQDIKVRLVIPKSVKGAPGPWLEATTDEDGFYMIEYKHTGKPTNYKFEIYRGNQLLAEKTVQLKGNEFEVVDIYLDGSSGSGDPGGGGTTTGTVHVADLQGSSKVTKKSWNATVTILASGQDGLPVPGAKVSGRWTVDGTEIAAYCETMADNPNTLADETGTCSVSLSRLDNGILSVGFDVTDIFVDGWLYEFEGWITHIDVDQNQ